MKDILPDSALDQLFNKARTCSSWTDDAIGEDQIRRIYELTKMGPTLANSGPARFVWLKSQAAKERLLPFMLPSNVEKTRTCAAALIAAYDMDWPEKLPELFPAAPGAKDMFAAQALRQEHGFRNSSLQAAYLIMAVRSLGLDAAPMSGFDAKGVDNEFFREINVVSNLVILVGRGDPQGLGPRLPRLSFETANTIL